MNLIDLEAFVSAERTLAEYEEFGYITRKRAINRRPPKAALKLARKVGVDLGETLERLLKEEGVSLEPGEQGP